MDRSIDAAPENLPQKKMLLLREQMPDRSPALGLRQVDVFTGLNSLILLLSLHRYGQDRIELKDKIHFYPSGQDIENEFAIVTTRLSNVIYYSDCLGWGSFTSIVGRCLDRADLSRADLSRTFLRGANLSSANLSRADLSSADLVGANLNHADLSRADLSRTSLFGADLFGADLSRADLSRVFLSGANLSGANLSSAVFFGADLEDIRWNAETNWEDVIGLDSAHNVPEALKQQLGL
jgi:hypothetical protein